MPARWFVNCRNRVLFTNCKLFEPLTRAAVLSVEILHPGVHIPILVQLPTRRQCTLCLSKCQTSRNSWQVGSWRFIFWYFRVVYLENESAADFTCHAEAHGLNLLVVVIMRVLLLVRKWPLVLRSVPLLHLTNVTNWSTWTLLQQHTAMSTCQS